MPKIIKGCKVANWDNPQLIENLVSPQYTKLIIPKHIIEKQVSDPVSVRVSGQVKRLLSMLTREEKSTNQLMKELNIIHRAYFRKNFLKPALESNFIEMTIPDTPNSRNQKYRITPRAKKFVEN